MKHSRLGLFDALSPIVSIGRRDKGGENVRGRRRVVRHSCGALGSAVIWEFEEDMRIKEWEVFRELYYT